MNEAAGYLILGFCFGAGFWVAEALVRAVARIIAGG